jgi:hypothetical protein
LPALLIMPNKSGCYPLTTGSNRSLRSLGLAKASPLTKRYTPPRKRETTKHQRSNRRMDTTNNPTKDILIKKVVGVSPMYLFNLSESDLFVEVGKHEKDSAAFSLIMNEFQNRVNRVFISEARRNTRVSVCFSLAGVVVGATISLLVSLASFDNEQSCQSSPGIAQESADTK